MILTRFIRKFGIIKHEKPPRLRAKGHRGYSPYPGVKFMKYRLHYAGYIVIHVLVVIAMIYVWTTYG